MRARQFFYVYIVRDGKYVFANEYGASLLGYPSPEEVQGTSVKDTIEHTNPFQADPVDPSQRFRIYRKHGKSIWMESISVPIEYQKRPATLVIGRDISATVEVEEKLQKESSLYSSRSELLEYPFSHDASQTLRKVIDLVCALTESSLGFFHLVKPYGRERNR